MARLATWVLTIVEGVTYAVLQIVEHYVVSFVSLLDHLLADLLLDVAEKLHNGLYAVLCFLHLLKEAGHMLAFEFVIILRCNFRHFYN